MIRSFCISRLSFHLRCRIFAGKLRGPASFSARIIPALLFLLVIGSCASQPVRTGPAEKSEYSPTKVFALDFSSVWEATLLGLREKGIPVGMQDREKGIIRTNFQDGQELKHLGKVYSSRYKYNIFLFREGENKSILNLRCYFEGKEKEGKVFFDGSYLFPGEVVALENRMYQAIESYLLPLQASRTVEPSSDEQPQETKRSSAALAPAKQVPPPESVVVQGVPPAPSPAGREAPSGYSKVAPEKDPRPPSSRTAGSRLAANSPSGKAAPGVPPKTATSGSLITKREANLREGPSLKSKIILTLKKGTKMEKLGQSSTWINVKVWGKTIGWVSKELLQEVP
jgi:hypothetical protein